MLVSAKGLPDVVEISVVDQGIGIPEREVDRIFERFYRVDPARHRSTGGTGLGLSIVKHVAATHGGDIRVWSVEGQGSTFTLTLPRKKQETRPVTRVLVVEDEESYSDALAYMLRKEGFEVAIATTGPDALAEFDRNGADIVLLDLMLPGLPGTEVCRQIRATSSVPVIMVSAKDDEVDKVVGLELGADDYVTKPYSPARAGRPDPGRAAPRCRRGPDRTRSALEAGPVRMDVERHVVTVNGEEQRLPLKEFELLEMFLRNPGRVLTRGQLIDRVWGSDYVGDTKTLDVHVKRLRAKLEPNPSRAEVPRDRARAGLQARPLRRGGPAANLLTESDTALPRTGRISRNTVRKPRVRGGPAFLGWGSEPNVDDRPSWLPLAAVACTLVFWASAFVAIRHLGDDFSPGALSLGRLLVGALCLDRGRAVERAAPAHPRASGCRSWSSGCCGSASTTSRSTRASGGSTPAPPPC